MPKDWSYSIDENEKKLLEGPDFLVLEAKAASDRLRTDRAIVVQVDDALFQSLANGWPNTTDRDKKEAVCLTFIGDRYTRVIIMRPRVQF